MGAPAFSYTLLPQPNDPGVDVDEQYQGQIAQYSQTVQLDDQGGILFFIIDGRTYDGKGYLITDSYPSGATNELFKGITEVIAYAVPGNCGKWYLISSESGGLGAPYDLEFAVLDMLADNPLFTDPNRRGALLDLSDAQDQGFDPGSNWYPNLGSHSFTLNPPPYDAIPSDPDTKSRALHFEAVHHEALDRHFLFATTGYSVVRYEITGTDIVHLGVTAAPAPPVDAELVGRSAKGESEARAMGNDIVFSFTTYFSHLSAFPGDPFLHYPSIVVMRFDASAPSFPLSATTEQYYVAVAPNPIDAVNVNGATVDKFRIGGLEFSPNGQYLYWAMPHITGGPASIGCIDLSDDSFIDVVTTTPEFVDAELEIGTAPGGTEAALFMTGRDAGGNAWLGMLSGPNNPLTATWDPDAFALADVCLAAEGNSDLYYLLCAQAFDDPGTYLLQTEECCQAVFDMTAYMGYTALMGNQSWTTSNNPFGNQTVVRFADDLVIPVGAFVNATGLTFQFAPDATLIVDPGGGLILTDCVLEGSCGEGWVGVELRGTTGQDQGTGSNPAYQGKLDLRNSVVRDAMTGVLVARRSPGGALLFSGNGGVLWCNNSSFQNCKVGIDFQRYQNYQPGTLAPLRNRSRITATTFSVDEDYLGTFDFLYHVRLWRVDGIPFNGCTFQNLRTTETESAQRGHGIYSIDANYSVVSSCNVPIPLGGECPEGSYTRSTFTGLDHGIHALTSVTQRAFTVDRCAFGANVCGVFASGVVGAQVTRSNFEVGNSAVTTLTNFPDEQYWLEFHRGIYTYKSYGFTIEDNQLLQVGPYSSTEGIVIGYSDAHNDVVRRNTATGLERAFIGEGICADVYSGQTNFIGLQYLCNTNSGNGRDFWDRKVDADPDPNYGPSFHTMRTIQGKLTAPGANVFDQTCGDPVGDYKRTSTNGVLNYIYGASTADDPQCYTVPYVNKQQALAVPAEPCPVRDYRPRGERDAAQKALLVGELHGSKLAYGNTRYLYDQMIDGGSTDEVVQEIQGTWPTEAWELRDYLLAKSPYLSLEVLMEMVEKDVLPAAMVAEICIANPEVTKQEDFLGWLQEESGHPLPQYMADAIVASWDQKTYRFDLEAQLGEHHANMTQALRELTIWWNNDTIADPVDSLRAAWQELRTPAARYAEALLLVQQERFSEAADVIEGIAVEHDLKAPEALERERMLDLIAFLESIASSERTEAEWTSGEQDQLESIMDGAYDRPAVWAQNLLCFFYGRCTPPLTGGDDGLRVLHSVEPDVVPPVEPSLQVFPNPGSVWVAISYELPTQVEKACLVVRDISGREVKRIWVSTNQGELLWDVRDALPGAYTVELLNGGELLVTEKLIVQP